MLEILHTIHSFVLPSAARLVLQTKKYDPISPALRNLHWLPIKSRIKFKLLSLAYQCLYQLAPTYLTELLEQYKPERSLRSSKRLMFTVPKTSTKSYGERSFSHAASVLWNGLPHYLTSITPYEKFRSNLKTYLFKSK